jgi:hypothetical protein
MFIRLTSPVHGTVFVNPLSIEVLRPAVGSAGNTEVITTGGTKISVLESQDEIVALCSVEFPTPSNNPLPSKK